MNARLIAGCCVICFSPAKDEHQRWIDGEMMPHCGRQVCIDRLKEIDRKHQEAAQ